MIACRRSTARGQTRRLRGISVIPVFNVTGNARLPHREANRANFIRELFHAVASAEPALLVVKRGHTREPHVRVAQLAEMPHARHQRQPCARADVLLQVQSDLRRRHRVGVAPAEVHRLFHEGERRQPALLFEALAVLEVPNHQVVYPMPVL